MITLRQFERQYVNKDQARKKYVAALFRFGKFGGWLAFGNGENKRPLEKELPPRKQVRLQTPLPEPVPHSPPSVTVSAPPAPVPAPSVAVSTPPAMPVPAAPVPAPVPAASSVPAPVPAASSVHVPFVELGEEKITPPFDPSIVDEYGFVESLKLRACDVPMELVRYLPSTELVETVKRLYKDVRDHVDDLAGERDEKMEERHTEKESWEYTMDTPLEFEYDGQIVDTIALFRQMLDINFSRFFTLPVEMLESVPRPDVSFPVYLRDYCTSKSVRELTVCVPRIYYHFAACKIQVEALLMYLNRVPGFHRLFPYRLMSSKSENLFEVSARDFFTNNLVDVALYSIKTKKDESGEHGYHARFAVKDRARGKIVLFDPQGSFGLVDKYDPDFVILNRVFRSVTTGIRVKVVRIKSTDMVDVMFYGYPELHGFFEEIRVHVSTLFDESGNGRSEIRVGGWYQHKLPVSAVHGFTGVERATDALGYEGDQPSEGTCALVALMRASYVARMANSDPTVNPIVFVRDEIPCRFAVFTSMLAQSFNMKERNFRFEMLDRHDKRGFFVAVEGIHSHVWVYRVPIHKTTMPALKVVRLALSRLAMTTSVSMNPYMYRIKLVYPNRTAVGSPSVRYIPIDSKTDMSCVDSDSSSESESCRVVIEPLPPNEYNVSIFVSRLHGGAHETQLQEVIMSMDFVRTSFTRDMSRFLTTPPFDPRFVLLVMRIGNTWVPGNAPILQYFDPSKLGQRPEVWLLEKPAIIMVWFKAKSKIIRIDDRTTVKNVVQSFVETELSAEERVGAEKMKLKYEQKPDSQFFSDDTLMCTLTTSNIFSIVKLHVLPPDAHVVIRYYVKKYSPTVSPEDEREIRIPVTERTTFKDVKRQFSELVSDGIERIRMTRSFDSLVDVASDNSTLYPTYDRITLYYF